MVILRKDLHSQVYIFGICLLAASVPLSRFMMSVAQFILLGNWLLEGDLKHKFKVFFNNKPALLISSIYLLHFAGLFFTTDWDYAIKDLRTKVPLLLLPLFFSTTKAPDRRQLQWIYISYLSAVFAGTITGIIILMNQAIPDTREMSPFISHIRFSLNVCMAIVILVAWENREQMRKNVRNSFVIVLLLLWFLAYLYVSESFTGYFILGALVFIWLIVYSFQVKGWILKSTFLALVVLIPLGLFLYLQGEYNQFFQESGDENTKLTLVTPSAHWYNHDTISREVISGHRVWLYVSKEEMKNIWNERSSIPYDSVGRSGLKIQDVLIRFLTSKGYRKDSTGVTLLSSDEINHIENGIADVEETRGSPLHKRLRKIFWEYQNYITTGNPSGHSVMMRLEYWKASLGLIKKYPLTGVGTGDMNDTFNQYYIDHHSKLKPEWRRRSHNQYLSITVGFGIFGLLWFLFALIYPAIYTKNLKNFVFGCFFLILLLSMVAEDTIETQDGVTFAAFFYSFLLFADKEKAVNFE